jgi:hypothetical protein
MALASLPAFTLAAQAETVVVACQPDRISEKGVTRTLTPAEKTAGTWTLVFAYDLATGKACILDPARQGCFTNHKAVAEGEAIKLSATTYDRKFDLSVLQPTGAFTRANSITTWIGRAKACALLADVAVNLDKRPDAFN